MVILGWVALFLPLCMIYEGNHKAVVSDVMINSFVKRKQQNLNEFAQYNFCCFHFDDNGCYDKLFRKKGNSKI